MPSSPEAGKRDGRVLRTERSRRAIVEAALDLVSEGTISPTARMLSERSGVSHSTLFRLYGDLDSLYADVVALQAERIAPLLSPPLETTGALRERVQALAGGRARLYEAITPFRQQAMLTARSSERVAIGLRRSDEFLRTQALEMFQPELERSQTRAASEEVVDALTSWEMWQRLRSRQKLSMAEATSTVATALEAFLGND